MSYLPSDRSINLARQCLEWHSWLDFEQLGGLNSHLSRVYHRLATQMPFALITAGNDKAPKLLASLKGAGFKSIVLKAYGEENEGPWMVFFIENPFGTDNAEGRLSAISKNFDNAPYALPENGKINIFRVAGAEQRKFELSNMRPNHLRRVISLVLGKRIKKVESGMFTANPLITRELYTQAGLVSDVPIHLLNTAWNRLDGKVLKKRLSVIAGEANERAK